MKNNLFFMCKLLLAVSCLLFLAGCDKELWNHTGSEEDTVAVNPEYVPIDWEQASVTSYDDSTGVYSIRFSDTVPDIHPGSIITIDRDTTVLYRLVLSATTNGNTMNVTTTEAYLTDIFHDSQFTLSTALASKKGEKGLVFYPEAAYLLDGKGGYKVIDMASARKDNSRFTGELWSGTLFNLDGTVLAEDDNYKLWLEELNASLGVDLEMLLNFGGRTEREFVNNMVEVYRSKALRMRTSLIGKFDTEQKIRLDAHGGFSYAPDYDLWKHNLFRPVPIRFMVTAGPVVIPIVLWLRCDLYRQVDISGSGEISAYTGFSDHAELRGGFEWSQSGGIVPMASFENTFSLTPPTVEGKGQIQAKVWVFPRVKVMLYDKIGPSFDLMPWIADTIRGGFREEMLGQSNDYCAWSVDIHAGLDYRFGLSRNNLFFGYEVDNRSTERFTWIDQKLYHSPKKVLHASGRPQDGQTATVRFDVYDTNYLTHSSYKTLFPQIVKFEAGGQLSSEYGISVLGTAQVNWSPNNNDTLWAKLYDADGNVLAYDTVIVRSDCDCNITSGQWVDLGLPSGLLWASRNIGASSPTDYGNYYAWGETQPKSVYDWSTYSYYRSDNAGSGFTKSGFTKYCNVSDYGYNGFIDNLTTLQPADDAAAANWGSGARMPTVSEWQELVNYTTHQWVTVDGVNGQCFTGPNGNSIFLPASGNRFDDGLYDVGSYGGYWSSSLYSGYPSCAWYCYFYLDNVSRWDYRSRFDGLSVRAVRQN